MTDREDINTEYVLKNYGPGPLVLNIEKAAKQNNTFHTVLWTGNHMQLYTDEHQRWGRTLELKFTQMLINFFALNRARGCEDGLSA